MAVGMKLYAGVEIGATKQQIVLGDCNGDIYKSVYENVDVSDGAQGILKWIKCAMPPLIEQAVGAGRRVYGIGVGFGGIVESSTGRVILSVQVKGWDNFLLKSWCENNFGLPTLVVNDTVCGGFCEYILGSGRGADIFFYTNIGSGIGGSLFFGGQNFDGQGYGAAYFGNTYIPSLTETGEPAKIENICSGFAIERRLRTPGYVPTGSMLFEMSRGNCESLTCRDLHTAAKAGDAFAKAEVDLVAKSFGIGLANILTLFHPQRISIGGGVSHFGRLLLDPIEKYAKSMAFGPCGEGFELVQCTYTDMAVPMGAVLMAAGRSENNVV